ncbi:MAG: SDR family oxidoreductase [SAR86 cluster bacterium]|nr:SDR family oxidoreductase [SAR86 cluster bacterium]
MDFKLKNKTALVCASSEGLGKAAALELAKEGCKISMCARNSKNLERAASEIRSQVKTDVITSAIDLNDKDSLKSLVNKTEQEIGPIEILVNNAGGPPPGSFDSLSDEDWQQTFNLTLMSAISLSKLVLPNMKKENWGRIINIQSRSVKSPVPGLFLSNSMRLAAVGWAKALSDEVAEHGITVNTVCPGETRTQRLVDIFAKQAQATDQNPNDIEQAINNSIPAKRIGEPEELAALIAFLASERSGFTTGTVIQVDGGATRSFF